MTCGVVKRYPNINVTGTIKPQGLNIAGRISEVALNDTTWTPIPASPLTARNSLNIQNYTGDDIYLNYDNTALGFTGILVPSSSERNYDITDAIVIYAKSKKPTTSVIIEEIS